jgi:hypothetical protein
VVNSDSSASFSPGQISMDLPPAWFMVTIRLVSLLAGSRLKSLLIVLGERVADRRRTSRIETNRSSRAPATRKTLHSRVANRAGTKTTKLGSKDGPAR